MVDINTYKDMILDTFTEESSSLQSRSHQFGSPRPRFMRPSQFAQKGGQPEEGEESEETEKSLETGATTEETADTEETVDIEETEPEVASVVGKEIAESPEQVAELFTLDDLTVSKANLETAKKYSRLTAKKDYEVIIEDLEVLQRDLENSDDPFTRALAPAIIRFYSEYRADPQEDPTLQEAALQDYLAHRFRLPWLIPIVRDVKKVYKRQLHLGPGGEADKQVPGEWTALQTKEDVTELQKALAEFERSPIRSQDFLDAWFNYRSVLPSNVSNKLGASVFRQVPPGTRRRFADLELRGSHGDIKSYDFIYKTKGRGKDKFIVGKKEITRALAEKLQLVGFAKLPLTWPSRDLDWDWSRLAQKNLFPETDQDLPDKITTLLKELIPDVNRLLEQEYELEGVTSLRVILDLLQEYGHSIESLTIQNKETIQRMINLNLENLPEPTYEKARRTVISKLEDELTTSPILSDQVLNDPKLSAYDLQIDPLMTSQLQRFFQVIRKADLGLIWLQLVRNQSVQRARKKTFKIDKVSAQTPAYNGCPKPEQFRGAVVLIPDNPTVNNLYQTCVWDSQQGRYLSKKEYLEKTVVSPLFAPTFEEIDISKAIRNYKIINNFLEVQRGLLKSYWNLWLEMGPVPDPSLLADLTNPLDALWGLKPEARDKEAWFRYFLKANPDAENKNYFFKGKWIGCQHEYDRLAQIFKDPSDTYPMAKRYTQMQQNNGIICGFCGEELKAQDDLITQGYDSFGRKINTYDNPGLVRVESTIQQFFRQKSEPVLFASTKILDPWNRITKELPDSGGGGGRSGGRGGGSDDKESKNPQKYEILKRYQDFIQDATFGVGLEQDPNKLPKKADETGFIKYLISDELKNVKITRLNSWFLERLNPLFVAMDRSYELVIRRISVLLVSLNWWLIHKEAQWLNLNVMLNTWTPQLIGQVFLTLNFQYTQMMRRMKDLSLDPDYLKKDLFWDHFQRDFRQSFRTSYADLTAVELEAEMLKQYRILQKQFLYVRDSEGDLFNGFRPMEHEVVRIFNNYLTKTGREDLISLLKTTFNQFWNQYLENPERKAEVDHLRRQMVQTLGTEFQLIDVKKPTDQAGYDVRQLYERYLAQEVRSEQAKLQQLYLDLINDNIYEIQDELGTSTSEDLLHKKMYYLGKMNCDDWSDMTELEIIGLDSEVVRIEAIMKVRVRITNLRDSQIPRFLWQFVGSQLQVDYRPDPYQVYRTPFVPFPVINAKFEKLTVPRSFKFSDPGVDLKKVITGKSDDLSKFYQEMNFIKNLPSLIENLGERFYLKDLKEAEKEVAQIINGQFYDARVCVSQRELIYPRDDFNRDWQGWIKTRYHGEKMKIKALKKYIISYVRHYIELFSNLHKEDWQTYGLLDRYSTILRQDRDAFIEAFTDFQITLENEQLEEWIDFHLDKPKEWSRVIQILQYILVKDLSEHLRKLRIEAGQYRKGRGRATGKTTKSRKGKSQKGGAFSVKGRVNLNAHEIFQEFVRILFKEIEFQYQVSNVDWNHKEVNQSFNQRSIWDQQAKIKSQDSLDWKILKFQLSIAETEEMIAESGPDLDADLVNNEDDLIQGNEMDFDLGDDGNDYDEQADPR